MGRWWWACLVVLVGAALASATAKYPAQLYTHVVPVGPYKKEATTQLGQEVQAIEAALGAGLSNVLATSTINTSAKVAGIVGDETGTGALVFQAAPLLVAPELRAYSYAQLPTPATPNRIVILTDAASATSCSAGGGSNVVLCRDTGAAWTTLGDGSGGGGAGHTIARDAATYTDRTVLSFLSGSGFTVTDNAGAGRTDIGLSVSPSSSSLVGTGRTITVPSPLSGTGTLASDLTFSWQTQSQNRVFAGPTSGSGTPSFRALVPGDIPSALDFTNLAASMTVDAATAIALGAYKLTFSETGAGVVEIRAPNDPWANELRFAAGSGSNGGVASITTQDVSAYGANMLFAVKGAGSDNWPTNKQTLLGLYSADGTVRVQAKDSSSGPGLAFTGTETANEKFTLSEKNGSFNLRRGGESDLNASIRYSFTGDWMAGNSQYPAPMRLSMRSTIGYPDTVFGALTSFSQADGDPGRIAVYHGDNDAWPAILYGGYAVLRRDPPSAGVPPFATYTTPYSYGQPQTVMAAQTASQAALSVREKDNYDTLTDPNELSTDEALTIGAATECANTNRSICDSFQGWNAGLTCTESASHASWDGTAGGCGGGPCTAKKYEACGPGTAGTCTGNSCTNIAGGQTCTTDADCEAGFALGRRYYATYVFEDYDQGDPRDPTQMGYDLWRESNCITCIGGPRGVTRRSRQAVIDVPVSASTNGRGWKFQGTLPKLCYGISNGVGTVRVAKCTNTSTSCSSDADCSSPTDQFTLGGQGNFCQLRRKVCTTDADCGGDAGTCRYAPEHADRVRFYVAWNSDDPAAGYTRKTPTDIFYTFAVMPTRCTTDAECGGISGSCVTLGDATKECKAAWIIKEPGFYENNQASNMNQATNDILSVYPAWVGWYGDPINPAVSIHANPSHKYALQILYGYTHRNGALTNAMLGTTVDVSGNFWTKGNYSASVGGGNVVTCEKITKTYAALTSAATTQTLTLKALPARSKLLGATVKHSTAFSGGSINSMTASVGSSAGTATRYCSAFDVYQAAGATAFQDCDTGYKGATTMAADDVTATFTSNANVNTATAGSVDFDLCWVTLP